MAELVVHIGMGKAASTTIQRSVLGDPTAPTSIGRHFSKNYEEKGLHPMWWRGLMSPSPDKAEHTKKIIEEEYLDANNLVVLSDEVIGGSPVLLDNLLSNLSRFELTIKFLLVTRLQCDFLQSLFNHSHRSRINAFGLPPFHRELSNRLFYKGDIRIWLDDLINAHVEGDRNILECLAYDNLINRLKSVSGEGGIVVLPMELLKANREEFAASLAEIFGMETENVSGGLKNRQNVSGDRLRDYYIGASVETMMGKEILKPLRKIGLTRRVVSKFLLPILSITKMRRQSAFDEDMKRKISDYYNEHNRVLDTMLPYDLRQLGYY